MYHFEGRITRRDGYYISRDVSRAAMDAWTDMSPMGPRLRDSGLRARIFVIPSILFVSEAFCGDLRAKMNTFINNNNKFNVTPRAYILDVADTRRPLLAPKRTLGLTYLT
uniref:Uncharacterized protein n=1 Tax=Solanum tuberosum TaxID=4113 RepID=M1DX42_SOLTU